MRAMPARRVLIVEDNADTALTTALIVRHLGHTAEAAADGFGALVQARKLRPDFALVDLNLPGGMDCAELARRLKAEHPSIRLIALTGSALAEDRERTREAGFEVHLVKPMDPAYLESLLGRV